jgi:hypothetical protein
VLPRVRGAVYYSSTVTVLAFINAVLMTIWELYSSF